MNKKNKIKILIILTLIIIQTSSVIGINNEIYCGGNGSKQNPYQICDENQFQNINLNLDSHFKLNNDLNLSKINFSSIAIIKPFTGTFNGEYNTIYNLKLNQTSAKSIGLFTNTKGTENEKSIIKNLILKNITITGKIETGSGLHTGGLIGIAQDTIIEKIYVDGNINTFGSSIGGITGNAINSEINQIISKINISGRNRIGGIIGESEQTNINNSYYKGKITHAITKSGHSHGGLIGYMRYGTKIENSYTNGEMIDAWHYQGGLVGIMDMNNLTSYKIKNTISAIRIQGIWEEGNTIGYYPSLFSIFNNTYVDQTRTENPNCVNGHQTLNDCTTINEENYFTQDILNKEPYRQWDFNKIWKTRINDFPELIWIEIKKELVDLCSICYNENQQEIDNQTKDLIISNNIEIKDNTIKMFIESINIGGQTNITIIKQSKEGIIEKEKEIKIQIKSNEKNIISHTFLNDISENDILHITVNQNKIIFEDNYKNNIVQTSKIKEIIKPKVYLEIELDKNYSMIEEPIKEYLSTHFEVKESIPESNYHLIIGKNAIKNYLTNEEILNHKLIEKDFTKEYTSKIISRYKKDYSQKKEIIIISNGIQGTIAAIKKLTNEKKEWFQINPYEINEKIKVINNYDKLGLKTIDYINNNELEENKVYNFLFDQNKKISIIPVKTTNQTSYKKETQLRIKNLKEDLSQKYIKAFNLRKNPVVMAGGIYSNLNTFEEFGTELIKEGEDVYLIEITGGPDEEDNTPYTYEDLENHFVPTLLAGVHKDSNKTKINYIGHSNGCRSALTSLSKHTENGIEDVGYYWDYENLKWSEMDFIPESIDKFFGIACPTTLNEIEWSSNKLRKIKNDKTIGDIGIEILKSENHSNIKQKEFLKALGEDIAHHFGEENKISLNLQEFYKNLMIENNSEININKELKSEFTFFSGTDNYYVFKNWGGDGVVPKSDIEFLNNIFINSKLYYIDEDHSDIISDDIVKVIISNKLK